MKTTNNSNELAHNNTDTIDPITPPISPINQSLSLNNSTRIKPAQTGLPWLTKDAEGSLSQPHQSNMYPPPKFEAKPKFKSMFRLHARKKTNQRYVYRMKDGINPVKILCRRLKSWQLSVKYLMSLFKKIKHIEYKNGKGYRAIDTNFAIPKKIQDTFKSSNGVQDAWLSFRQFTRENSLIHQDFVDFIENEMIPTLRIILTDIHQFMHSLINNKSLHTDSLYNHRNKADTVITKFGKEIHKATTDHENLIKSEKGPYFIPKKDPLLTKYAVTNAVINLHKHENRLHRDFLAAQDEYKIFEQKKVIDVYTDLFQSFELYRDQHGLERSEGVSQIVKIFNAIEIDSEWHEFLHHHQNELVKATAAFKDENTLDFPNMSHPLAQPLLMDNLNRKIGSSKWCNEYYVLSSVGIIYCFKSEKEFLHRPYQPLFRLFLPSSEVQLTNSLLKLKGNTLGFFNLKKTLELTSVNFQVVQNWAKTMCSIAENKPAPDTVLNKDGISHPENDIKQEDDQGENINNEENTALEENPKNSEISKNNDFAKMKRQESDLYYDTVS